ncbi:MAG TPA: metallophosphoesterase [Myxococcales bacterium]|nr:metallophosphoesterase [Myxococcales bacterium]
MRILHCSDVHVTLDYLKLPLLKLGWRRWIALGELWRGRARAYSEAGDTIRQIVRDFHSLGADHLIVSGDLTAYALPGEFEGARAALGDLASDPRRCTVIPGNHDVYTPGAYRDQRFERTFQPLLRSDLPEYQREGIWPMVRLWGEDVAIIGLKSARVPAVPGLSFGVIGRRQLGGLRDAVNDPRLSERAVVVVVHHAPLTRRGRRDKLHHGLADKDALFRIARGPRFAVLHGHIHQRYHHAATETRPHLFGAGSSTQRGREGYWLIEVERGRIAGGRMLEPGAAAASAA